MAKTKTPMQAEMKKLLDEGWQFTLDANAPKQAQSA